jgi:Mlc titration factor MtfA (ptsG expression regulator)
VQFLIYIPAITLLAMLIWAVKFLSRQHRRKVLFTSPPPTSWNPILERTFPTAKKLPDTYQRQLFGHMQIFLNEKQFEGCGGLEITEEIQVTIAAQACMLLLGRNARTYPRLKTVLVYPDTYKGGKAGLFGGDNGKTARLGESWGCGVVVLAWNSVLGGARNMEDGHNVTFHEFAHQLDQEDGTADGAPILEKRSAYLEWARVLQHEYDVLVAQTRKGRKSIMDRYGATNPAEFFAVATETFFEKPRQLQSKLPELYKELQHYYKVDPIQWT